MEIFVDEKVMEIYDVELVMVIHDAEQVMVIYDVVQVMVICAVEALEIYHEKGNAAYAVWEMVIYEANVT